MSDGKPMQADGGTGARADGVDQPEAGGGKDGGQSAGGAYARPDIDKPGSQGGIMGHGGQKDVDYHGPGQLGDEDVDGRPNPNSATKQDD